MNQDNSNNDTYSYDNAYGDMQYRGVLCLGMNNFRVPGVFPEYRKACTNCSKSKVACNGYLPCKRCVDCNQCVSCAYDLCKRKGRPPGTGKYQKINDNNNNNNKI